MAKPSDAVDPIAAVIDTESQSARQYAGVPGVPPFHVCELAPPFDPRRYVAAIHAAGRKNCILRSTGTGVLGPRT